MNDLKPEKDQIADLHAELRVALRDLEVNPSIERRAVVGGALMKIADLADRLLNRAPPAKSLGGVRVSGVPYRVEVDNLRRDQT